MRIFSDNLIIRNMYAIVKANRKNELQQRDETYILYNKLKLINERQLVNYKIYIYNPVSKKHTNAITQTERERVRENKEETDHL